MSNQAENPRLSDIDLHNACGKGNKNFSAEAKDKVALLKAKGINIAQTMDESDEMDARYL